MKRGRNIQSTHRQRMCSVGHCPVPFSRYMCTCILHTVCATIAGVLVWYTWLYFHCKQLLIYNSMYHVRRWRWWLLVKILIMVPTRLMVCVSVCKWAWLSHQACGTCTRNCRAVCKASSCPTMATWWGGRGKVSCCSMLASQCDTRSQTRMLARYKYSLNHL